VHHKPDILRKELERLYDIGSSGKTIKLNATQIHDELQKLKDPVDYGLMSCYSKRGEYVAKTNKEYKAWAGCTICSKKPCECNEMLPPIWMIQNFINGRTKGKKKLVASNIA
jgi:hypothetical protein